MSPLPDCPTCDPQQGGEHRCACRAGYKSGVPGNEYRIAVPEYGFLVFVPEGTQCNTLCNEATNVEPNKLCSEVTNAQTVCKGIVIGRDAPAAMEALIDGKLPPAY
ncbi:hypothetical protein FE257_009677 [Aspergillus nanangensis]|uniref:Uncharacterized protein n=1 Tax=Aspergillus nanangensis TaxID=2582783 RepID=A0AAD4CJJ1_ASPNN|nr:hypothetical protein FE257_009677 [Aspergillus nanangensis]